MREILFRGKRLDNGEWIEGFYAQSGEKSFIIIDNDIAFGYVSMKEVIPETVGQFTGLTDKYGKKIFEGDIVCWPGTQLRDVVQYGEFNCSCCAGVCGWSFGSEDIRSHDCYEVIGNIHDNPELIGGGESENS